MKGDGKVGQEEESHGEVEKSRASILLTSSCQLFTSLEAPSSWNWNQTQQTCHQDSLPNHLIGPLIHISFADAIWSPITDMHPSLESYLSLPLPVKTSSGHLSKSIWQKLRRQKNRKRKTLRAAEDYQIETLMLVL